MIRVLPFFITTHILLLKKDLPASVLSVDVSFFAQCSTCRMEVRLLLLLLLLHGVTLFCAVNGDNMTEENIRDTQSVTSRPTTMQNITTLQCDNCTKKTKHPTTHVLPTNHSAQGPSPSPSPTEYIVIGISGVCLRIKAIFIVMLNTTKITNITIPSPPITLASGVCSEGEAWLGLIFPGGDLSLTFMENKTDSLFYLGEVGFFIEEEDESNIGGFMSLETLVTPLGHSFTCEEVILRTAPNMSVVLLDVEVEAFTLKRDNFTRDSESTFIIYDNKYKTYEDIIRILSISSRHWSVTILVPWIYTVVFLLALPLNIMAVIMFLVKMKVTKPAVVYMLNLATADVLLISILPFYIVYRFLGSNWIFGEGMCRFVMAAFYCNMYCSILLMTSISVDRFLAVVYPVRSLPWRTVTRAWLVCGVIWVISLASTVPLLIQKQTMTLSVLDITMCYDSQHFGAYYIFSVFNSLPLFITTFCYIGIIRSLSRSKFDRTHKRSRAIRLTAVVLSLFLLCFGPTNVIYFIYYKQLIRNEDYSLYCTYIIFSSISSINCCLDPLIYYFASSQCQRYVYSLLRWKQDYCPPVHKEQSPLRTQFAQFIKSG
ncbi:uncharacterized protein [Aquarana catesbeiana]|uniref:uncharacterized protein n=1 Tax=Aquarana catesbeiana TaxID=8400 RepID=UPI003CC9C6DA